ncbi:hypothetical protein J6Z39_01690 [bacterium]|nr:hypothetical protein [bacterium]MBR6244311.1 hypothetical protein [bacterium]
MMSNIIKQRGAALFISLLLTTSIAILSMASMSRLSEMTHSTGRDLEDMRLTLYAQSASYLVNARIQELVDADLQFDNYYVIPQNNVDGGYEYYPKRSLHDNALSGDNPILFGYRAVATVFAGKGDQPAGLKDPIDSERVRCYDITIDVREVHGSQIKYYGSDTLSDGNFYFGKMKTFGTISCFSKENVYE